MNNFGLQKESNSSYVAAGIASTQLAGYTPLKLSQYFQQLFFYHGEIELNGMQSNIILVSITCQQNVL